MSYGQMNSFIDIISAGTGKDADGFAIAGDTVLASVRAYREQRRGTKAWANRAAFSEATDLFRFRVIPGLAITTSHIIVCDNGRYQITSVESVKGQSMYEEVLAKKVESARG